MFEISDLVVFGYFATCTTCAACATVQHVQFVQHAQLVYIPNTNITLIHYLFSCSSLKTIIMQRIIKPFHTSSPKSSDNITLDKEHMDSDESIDNSTESEPGDDSTESESGYNGDSIESESGDDDNSTKSSTIEDVWDDMILEVYNTEDYATKVSEYANDYQNAEKNAKRNILKVHESDLKFNYCKLLLTYHRMQASKMPKKIITNVIKSCTSPTAIERL